MSSFGGEKWKLMVAYLESFQIFLFKPLKCPEVSNKSVIPTNNLIFANQYDCIWSMTEQKLLKSSYTDFQNHFIMLSWSLFMSTEFDK